MNAVLLLAVADLALLTGVVCLIAHGLSAMGKKLGQPDSWMTASDFRQKKRFTQNSLHIATQTR